MLRCTATQSLSHWKRFRTNWKHCNVSIPSLCVPAWAGEIQEKTGRKLEKLWERKVWEDQAQKSRRKKGIPTPIDTRTQTHTHMQGSYRLALSLSSPPVSSASACPLRLPGFLCGAPEFQTLIRSAGHFAPGPPPQACVGKWNCSGRSTGNILYCCQIPVRQTKSRQQGTGFVLNDECVSVSAPLSLLTVFFIQMQWLLLFPSSGGDLAVSNSSSPAFMRRLLCLRQS